MAANGRVTACSLAMAAEIKLILSWCITSCTRSALSVPFIGRQLAYCKDTPSIPGQYNQTCLYCAQGYLALEPD